MFVTLLFVRIILLSDSLSKCQFSNKDHWLLMEIESSPIFQSFPKSLSSKQSDPYIYLKKNLSFRLFRDMGGGCIPLWDYINLYWHRFYKRAYFSQIHHKKRMESYLYRLDFTKEHISAKYALWKKRMESYFIPPRV